MVEWLGEEAGVGWSICALFEEEEQRLVGIAGHGVSSTRVRRFSIEIGDLNHPLGAVFSGDVPVRFPVQRGRWSLSSLMGKRPFWAFPLFFQSKGAVTRVGLLLTSLLSEEAERLIRWFTPFWAQSLWQRQTLLRLAAAEHRLLQERALLQKMLDAVPDPILLTDLDGHLLLTNRDAERLFTAAEEENEGRHRAVSLNKMFFSAALSRRILEEPETFRRELPLVDPSEGTDLLFELMSTAISDERLGSKIVSVLRNVTDLRSATEEIEANYQKLRLAESRARAERDQLNLIIDSVADPVLVTDPGGNFLLMNAPAERLFTAKSSSKEEERAVRANDANFSSFVSNLFLSGEDMRWRGEISLADPQTGDVLPFEAISGKILSERGEVMGVATILHDRREAIEKARLYEQLKQASAQLQEKVREATSELVRQNEILRRQQIELEQASALKSQFLANMSHEFRTPLNAILGYTSMLLEGVNGEIPANQRRSLERIDSNAKSLLSIINDILDISRIESGKMPLRLETFSLPTLIAEVMEEVEPIIAHSRLAVSVSLAPKLPSLRSDRQKAKQIVLNLLSNALKFTHEGSILVSASYDKETRQFFISVKDTGIGIPESEQESIFEVFQQVDNSPTRQYGGAGLGLPICRRLAAMLKGKITLESQPGVGSTFTLCLPRSLRRRS